MISRLYLHFLLIFAFGRIHSHSSIDVFHTGPVGWTCAARRYNEIGTGLFGPNGKPDCDCGCGIWDPDCEDFTFRQRSEVGLLCDGNSADELNPTEEDLDLSTFCDRGALQCDSSKQNWIFYFPRFSISDYI